MLFLIRGNDPGGYQQRVEELQFVRREVDAAFAEMLGLE